MTYVDTADLIATGIGQGANMVEFRQGVAGSSSRTVQTKLLEQVSVFDFMSTAQIAAVQSGTSTDDGAALYQALAAGRRVFLPAGTYRLEDITIPSNRTLYGEGPDATIIKLKARATVRRPLALFGTSHASISNLTVDGDSLALPDDANGVFEFIAGRVHSVVSRISRSSA